MSPSVYSHAGLGPRSLHSSARGCWTTATLLATDSGPTTMLSPRTAHPKYCFRPSTGEIQKHGALLPHMFIIAGFRKPRPAAAQRFGSPAKHPGHGPPLQELSTTSEPRSPGATLGAPSSGARPQQVSRGIRNACTEAGGVLSAYSRDLVQLSLEVAQAKHTSQNEQAHTRNIAQDTVVDLHAMD